MEEVTIEAAKKISIEQIDAVYSKLSGSAIDTYKKMDATTVREMKHHFARWIRGPLWRSGHVKGKGLKGQRDSYCEFLKGDENKKMGRTSMGLEIILGRVPNSFFSQLTSLVS